jgi:flavin-binding protein dodecin
VQSRPAGFVASGAGTRKNRGFRREKEIQMANNTYRVTEIVGTSTEGVDDAIKGAVTRAAATLRGLDWFEVTEIRGHIEDGAVAHVQVGLKVGFRLEE